MRRCKMSTSRSIRYRRGTKRNKKRNHKPLKWYTEQYGTSGREIYERLG